MEISKKTQTIIGVLAVGTIAYLLLNRRKDKVFANASASKPPAGIKLVAGGWDSGHRNPDGTTGAQWISYGGQGAQGYWEQNPVPRGTIVGYATPRGKGGSGSGKMSQGPLGPNRPAEPCSSGVCVDGRCTVSSYNQNGNITSTAYYTCSGSGNNIRVGNLMNAF